MSEPALPERSTVDSYRPNESETPMRNPAAHKHEQLVADMFLADTTTHQMRVALDNGTHRHLKFRAGDTSLYWFDIITWPGVLTIRGDMGTYVFARTEDMFAFFRGSRINPGYWAEKAVADSGVRRFDSDVAVAAIGSVVDSWADDVHDAVAARVRAAVAEQVLCCVDYEGELRAALDSFEHEEFEFTDTFELDFTAYTTQFLWSCHAIRWAIGVYDAAALARQAPKVA